MKINTNRFETKNLKHTFTDSEAHLLGRNLGLLLNEKSDLETEFDGVKADYKAKIAVKDSSISELATKLRNGFDLRDTRCAVVFIPKDKKKHFFIVTDESNGEVVTEDKPALVENMTPDDFQQELIEAESKFDAREEIELFKPADGDRGILVVGRLAGKWFSALRVKIGKLELTERLDAEQPCCKERPDAVAKAIKRVNVWAKDNLKDLAAGFQESFKSVAEAQKERAE